ncbi:hypothetical protein E4T50_12454, partial [Aureobasidium sp. EXF-12298]
YVDDSLLIALAQNGALRLRCDCAVVSLVDEDGSPRVTAEAGQSTSLSAPCDRSASLERLHQQVFLDRLDSLAPFRGRRSAEQSDNVIANQTRHIIRNLDLLYKVPNRLDSAHVSYAAVPIKSVSGQLLGFYSVMDSKIRHDFLGHETYTILDDIASATSQYLESQHIQMKKDHDTRAALNLSKFLEHNRPRPARNFGLPCHPKTRTQLGHGTSSPSNSSSSSNDSVDKSLDETAYSTASTPLTTPAEETSGFSFVNPPSMPVLDEGCVTRSSRTSTAPNTQHPHRALSVAADLIRAAHDLEGLVLLDATYSSDHSSSQSIHNTTAERPTMSERLEVSIVKDSRTPTRITSLMSLEHKSLGLLISHFPGGCVLKTGDEGTLALVITDTLRSGPALYTKLGETVVMPPDLQLLLGQGQSLMFMPLWDSARQAFYACMLGWAVNSQRVFTEHDLLSLSIHGRILTAEISRLVTWCGGYLLTLAAADAIDTEATKSDFVSSLSHELRSPLHGCLGAVEVLRDTGLDKSQTDLLGMIDSCASTLLFTMNHLLDFSRINDLDRTQSRNRGHSHGEPSSVSPRNTFGQVSEDYLCRIVQGVVEGVWYGHDREQAAHERGSNAFLQDHDLHLDRDSTIVENKDVAIFLYMESHAAWFSMVSAGAWKRLVMNLFGNSLKFCQRGHIEVTLKMVPDPKNPDKKMTHLMVSDTGIGMSENFVKNALYRPFVQANTLVRGTGLGLNIVKQIVNDLQGTISVTSTLGVGTRFDVFIPLVERKSVTSEVIPDGGEMLDPESILRGRTLCLLSSSHTTSEITDTLHERTNLVHSYVKWIAENWFQMKVISADMADEVDADVYVAEISDFASYVCSTSESSGMANRHRTILVGNQREISQTRQQYSNDLVDLKYPLGPRSLSCALHTAMRKRIDQASQTATFFTTTSSLEQTEENAEIEAVSHEPDNPLSEPADLTQTEHLLLVDDNAINLKLLSTFVKKLSFNAHTAVDGEDAFETYKQFSKTRPFTTILMDISMPKMNGFESSRAIREFEVENGLPSSRIIALTALGSEASRREAEASGIDGFQTKPVALKTLKGLLKSTS